MVTGAEQRPIVIQNDFVAFGKVGIQRLTRRFAEIDEALLVSFACYANPIVVYVISIQTDQLRAADAAVQKQHQDRIVACPVRPVDRSEQTAAFLERQILRQGAAHTRVLDVQCRIFVKQLRAGGQIFEKRLDGRKLPRACRRTEAGAVLRPAFAGQIAQEVEDIVRRHASQKFDIDAPDGDRLQIGVDRHFAAHEHKEPQEHPQVQMIFVDGLGRLALDGLVVRQKLPQDLRSIRIDHNNTSKQAPGPENRHSALYASIIAYLCLKRNKIFILLRSFISTVRENSGQHSGRLRLLPLSLPAAGSCPLRREPEQFRNPFDRLSASSQASP